MWSPTHIQLTVGRCRGLIKKGKSGTNDAYVLVKCGSNKFQTSARDRSVDPLFNEKCDFPLTDDPKFLKVKVYHRYFLGPDVLLGQAFISLEGVCRDITKEERSWFKLSHKDASKNSTKSYGEIELFLTLGVRSQLVASRLDLTKKPNPIRTVAKTFGNIFQVKNSSKSSTLKNQRFDFNSMSKSCLDVSETRRREFIYNKQSKIEKIAIQEEDEEDVEERKYSRSDSNNNNDSISDNSINKNDNLIYNVSCISYDNSFNTNDDNRNKRSSTDEDRDDISRSNSNNNNNNNNDENNNVILRNEFDSSNTHEEIQKNFDGKNDSLENKDMEKFWKKLESTPVYTKVGKQELVKNGSHDNSMTDQQFFQSLLDTSVNENKDTQTNEKLLKTTSVATQVSIDVECQACVVYEEKMKEKVDHFPQKQDLFNLLRSQKSQIEADEKRITELEEYIDNLLANILEHQPQLLTSGTLLISEKRKRPANMPVYCNKDVEMFMKNPQPDEEEEYYSTKPSKNRTFKSIFF